MTIADLVWKMTKLFWTVLACFFIAIAWLDLKEKYCIDHGAHASQQLQIETEKAVEIGMR